ncbi:MAG: hypothetical protein LBK13_02105, partial [Spirochaetales bacterium]|nr:hypothetical protein [Spirochaetales bacterium]
MNRGVRKPHSLGNRFNIKTAEFAAILRQIRQTCERTGRLSNKSNKNILTSCQKDGILVIMKAMPVGEVKT